MTNAPDTPSAAATRFVLELTAWVLGPWVLSRTSMWLAVGGVIVLVGAPAVFNVPGDKKVTGIAVPAAVRITIELALFLVAAGAAWLLFDAVGAWSVTILAVVAAVLQRRRWRWMLDR